MQEIGIPVPRFIAYAIARAFPKDSYSAVISVTEDRFRTFGNFAYRALMAAAGMEVPR